MKFYIFASIILILSSIDASAEITIGQYNQVKNTDKVKVYVTGIGKGVFYTDVYLAVFKRKTLLCMPPKLELDQNIILQAIEKELVTGDYSLDSSIESIIPMALINRFPCSK